MAPLPSYDELPVVPGAPAGSSWGLWGDDDRFGCLNLIDDAATRRGLAAAVDGTVHPLNLELELPDPPLFGRSALTHRVHNNPWSADDSLDTWNTQASSQWDGFRHVRSPVHGAYNGVPEDEHGIHHWARRGIVTRAVLADVGRWREQQGRPLTPNRTEGVAAADVLATLEAQDTAVEPGDVLLIRFGWTSWYRSLDGAGRAAYAAEGGAIAGLAPGEEMARTLWDLHIAAVAADNPSLEMWPAPMTDRAAWKASDLADPTQASALFLHLSLLPLLGLPVGELFDLDGLAAHAERAGRWTCLFTSAPLHLHAGVASPPNALAIT